MWKHSAGLESVFGRSEFGRNTVASLEDKRAPCTLYASASACVMSRVTPRLTRVTQFVGCGMAFVKLDCGLLDSSLWIDREGRELFITALLMAVPHEVLSGMEQIEVDSLEKSGFVVPPGWYGLVRAAGSAIIHRSMMEMEMGMAALRRLGAPDADSRTLDFEGRRMIRVDGGFLILNYLKYREKDHTTAERSKRYRERKVRKKARAKGSGPLKGEAETLAALQDGRISQEQADARAAETREKG